jgi:hypothetical protein
MPRARAKAPAASNAAPWWLQEGDEECSSCGHLYIYELEFRCPQCESITCIHCRRRHAEGHLVCVSCTDTRGSSDGG